MDTAVLLVSAPGCNAGRVGGALRKHGYQVSHAEFEMIDLVAAANDGATDVLIIVVLTLNEVALGQLEALQLQRPLPVIVFAREHSAAIAARAAKAGVNALIVDELSTVRLRSIIEIAVARFHERRALREELLQSKDALEQRKAIDRAKGVLMAQGMTEHEAFARLRRNAMDTGKTMGEIAKCVLQAADLLKPH